MVVTVGVNNANSVVAVSKAMSVIGHSEYLKS